MHPYEPWLIGCESPPNHTPALILRLLVEVMFVVSSFYRLPRPLVFPVVQEAAISAQ